MRGLITDEGALEVLRGKSGDRYEFTVTESIPNPPPQAKYGEPPELDLDDAAYIGDGNDGVYFSAIHKGNTWWALATVDSDTGHFIDTLVSEGGHRSEKAALTAAKDAALEWCTTNNVATGEDEDESTSR